MLKIETFRIDAIHVADRKRKTDPATVKALAESIGRLGLLHPLGVRIEESFVIEGEEVLNVPILVYGQNRLEALRSLGRETALCVVFPPGENAAVLAEIAENLHRAELTVQERAEQIAEWVNRTAVKVAQLEPVSLGGHGTKVLAQVEPKPQGGRPESGVRAAARALGLDRNEVSRAVKIAGIAPEAKAAAKEVGLDDDQSALLTVAKEPEPAQQVAKVHNIAEAKAKRAQANKPRPSASEPPPRSTSLDSAEEQAALQSLPEDVQARLRKRAELGEWVSAKAEIFRREANRSDDAPATQSDAGPNDPALDRAWAVFLALPSDTQDEFVRRAQQHIIERAA
jgi:ParB-like chromosome segregation protein Spo0J